jgi:hypothetical protein
MPPMLLDLVGRRESLRNQDFPFWWFPGCGYSLQKFLVQRGIDALIVRFHTAEAFTFERCRK